MINIVNIKNKPVPYYDDYIGRGNKWLGLNESKWGNPFIMKKESERNGVLIAYCKHILSSPELIASLSELENRTLGCYCVPKICHGNVLIALYEEIVINKTVPESLLTDVEGFLTNKNLLK